DWECFKVYDSMEFEDDETTTQEHQFRAEGTLDAAATEALVGHFHQPGAPASSSYKVGPVQPARPLPTPPSTPGGPGDGGQNPIPKGKGKGKAPSLRKAATSKLSQISSKLAEARVLAADLPTASQLPLTYKDRSEKMKEGYEQELSEGKKAVEDARAQLESWYSRKLEDSEIVGEERNVYDQVIRAVDSAFVVLAGKMKAVKSATAPPKESKAKAKAKAARSFGTNCAMVFQAARMPNLSKPKLPQLKRRRSLSTPLHAYVMRYTKAVPDTTHPNIMPETSDQDSICSEVGYPTCEVLLNGTSFVGAREMLEAVNAEFKGYGMELGGAAGELISTSGKWSSNVQRDMLRKCKTAKVAAASEVPVTKLQVPVITKGVLMKRQLPVVLPHELFPWLVRHGIIPLNDTDEIRKFWSHARTAGMPTMGATDYHIPLYLWGDDARFTETHEDKLVVVAFGRVLETSKNALRSVWPLFVYQQVVKSFNILFEQGVVVQTPNGDMK
ncbi:unnamed protein product, partial [Symbiodinium necroappetens]